MEAEPEIICVECGGRCYLLSYRPPDGFEPGDVVAYRCAECLDRFDLQLPDDDDRPEPPPPS